MNSLTRNTPYMNVSLEKCDQSQIFSVLSFTLAAILKKSAAKNSAHTFQR